MSQDALDNLHLLSITLNDRFQLKEHVDRLSLSGCMLWGSKARQPGIQGNQPGLVETLVVSQGVLGELLGTMGVDVLGS